MHDVLRRLTLSAACCATVAAVLASAGCAGEAELNKDRVAAVGFIDKGKPEQAISILRPFAADPTQPDYALDNLVLARAAMAIGDLPTARDALLRANRTIDDAPLASADGGQRNATWQGDTHEKVMAAFYHGVCLLIDGDLDNARGAFEAARIRLQQQTAFEKEKEGQEDIEPGTLPFVTALLARTWDELGNATQAQKLREELPAGLADLARDGNVLLVVDTGAGPRRWTRYENNFIAWGQWEPDINKGGKSTETYLPAGPMKPVKLRVSVNGEPRPLFREEQGNLMEVISHRDEVIQARLDGHGGELDEMGAQLVSFGRRLFKSGEVGQNTGEVLAMINNRSEDRELRLPMATQVISLDLPPGEHEVVVEVEQIGPDGRLTGDMTQLRQSVVLEEDQAVPAVAYFAGDSLGMNHRTAGPIDIPVLDPRQAAADKLGPEASTRYRQQVLQAAMAGQKADYHDGNVEEVSLVIVNKLQKDIGVFANGGKAGIPLQPTSTVEAVRAELARRDGRDPGLGVIRGPLAMETGVRGAVTKIVGRELLENGDVRIRYQTDHGRNVIQLHSDRLNYLVIGNGEGTSRVQVLLQPVAQDSGKLDTIIVGSDGITFNYESPGGIERLLTNTFSTIVKAKEETR